MNAEELFVLSEEEEMYRQTLRSALRERVPDPKTGTLLRSLAEIRDATITEVALDCEKLDDAISAFDALGLEMNNEEKLKKAIYAFRALEQEMKRFLKNPHFDKKKFDEARKLANLLGLPGLGISEKFGGDGATSRQSIIVGEEISAVDPALALAFGAANTLAMKPIELFGTKEQKEKWLPAMVSGEFTGCYCQTTADNGTDVAGQTLSAREVGGTWRITKSCRFITGAFIDKDSGANVALVLARTASDSEKRHYGLTMFLVDMDRARREGTATFIRNEHKAGLHMSPTSEFSFDNAVADSILGELHDGWKVAMFILAASRGKAISPQAIGTGRAVSELAREYAAQRKVFGRTLDKFPNQRSELHRIDAGVYMSRLLAWRAALLLDEMGGLDSRPWQLEASCAKLFSAEMAEWAPSKAMQVMGGTGYVMAAKVAKFWHDGRVIKIYEGTDAAQCIVIMKDLLTKRLRKKYLWMLGAHNKFSFATRKAVAYRLARSWPVSSFGWQTEEKEFSFAMREVQWHIRELYVGYRKLLEQRYLFLTEFGKTLQEFPPDPDGDTFPSPYFKLAYAFAALEGAKLALWEAAFRVQHKGEALGVYDIALTEDSLRFAAEVLALSCASRENLSEFPSLRKEIEGKGMLKVEKK